MAFDLLIMDILPSLRHPVLDSFFQFITFWGSAKAFISLGLIILVLLIYKRDILGGIYLNLCLIVTWLVMRFLKDFFARPRPSGEHLTIATGMSFPSGHAMLSMAFYGFIAYLLVQRANSPKTRKLIWWLSFIFILLIGVSRVYLNVHYPSDIVAGFLFGALFLVAFIKIYEKHKSFY